MCHVFRCKDKTQSWPSKTSQFSGSFYSFICCKGQREDYHSLPDEVFMLHICNFLFLLKKITNTCQCLKRSQWKIKLFGYFMFEIMHTLRELGCDTCLKLFTLHSCISICILFVSGNTFLPFLNEELLNIFTL